MRGSRKTLTANRVSSILVMREPTATSDSLTKLWEFGCDIDTFAKSFAPGAGSVYELSDGSILVSMGGVNRNFIVDRHKNILWNSITLQKGSDGSWQPSGNYRVSPIEHRKDWEAIMYNK